MKGPVEYDTIPVSIFVNLIRKYILDDGCKEDYNYNKANLNFNNDSGQFLWHLTYKHINFSFSQVVLEYIINNQPEVFCNKQEYLKFIGEDRFKYSPWNKKSIKRKSK